MTGMFTLTSLPSQLLTPPFSLALAIPCVAPGANTPANTSNAIKQSDKLAAIGVGNTTGGYAYMCPNAYRALVDGSYEPTWNR